MSAFTKLQKSERRKIVTSLILRKKTFLKFINCNQIAQQLDVVVVGDRPGPSAPKTEGYHHTPFYSVKHCSFWLNSSLVKSCVTENKLLWLNAYDRHGEPVKLDLGALRTKNFVALGNNAAKWLVSNNITRFKKFDHPQYWKRFKSKMDYPLIDYLKQTL